MGDVSYRPLIEEMTWSYSRIECFKMCPYKFFRRYILGEKEEPRFYASYGSFVHKLLEEYYTGKTAKEDLKTKFLFGFTSEVEGRRPPGNVVGDYIRAGLEYFDTFEPFPYKQLGVEKMVNFEIGGYPFVGFIDFLGEKDGDIYLVDHKSRKLKPRSKRAKPTVADRELDTMLRQLYIYSKAVRDEYGRFPKALCFNCFANKEFIVEPFREDDYQKALDWARESIEEILDAESWLPNKEFFKCTNLCGISDGCEYYQEGTL